MPTTVLASGENRTVSGLGLSGSSGCGHNAIVVHARGASAVICSLRLGGSHVNETGTKPAGTMTFRPYAVALVLD